MDLIMHFWCELAASVGVAVGVYGGFVFILHRKDADRNQDSVPSREQEWAGEDAPPDENGVLNFLREAVRLAEERLKAQEEQTRTLERKATLLGALCVVTIAFLLTGEFDSAGALPVRLTAIVLLIISAALCARTIGFLHYGRMGIYALGIDQYIQNPRRGDHVYLLRCALDEHYASIALNDRSIEDNITIVSRARKWWMCGAAAALGSIAGNGVPVDCLCIWLVG